MRPWEAIWIPSVGCFFFFFLICTAASQRTNSHMEVGWNDVMLVVFFLPLLSATSYTCLFVSRFLLEGGTRFSVNIHWLFTEPLHIFLFSSAGLLAYKRKINDLNETMYLSCVRFNNVLPTHLREYLALLLDWVTSRFWFFHKSLRKHDPEKLEPQLEVSFSQLQRKDFKKNPNPVKNQKSTTSNL